ncbi:glycolate oxidase subunit GlcE [Rhizobium sp. C4]|uniref:glycolate oxidase subunit GlcE n=1 Tax=Rhizobium sp. C4 TaxID=1349800 RepID=UPI001E2CF753|nr:glycolate oxidase subunit GlcE [Rhizobium sp. C4]MCD2172842.1 glycolate oxidase subunit GlcE [Rhizobium sp. C4]
MAVIFEPESEADAAAMIADAAREGRALAISGGNTRAGFGRKVEGATFTSKRLRGITAYNPSEMTLTALAGTPVAEIEAELADNGQMMAFEPADHRMMMGTEGVPTIGGIFATNTSGPRRFVSGAARDSLLGIRFVNGMGEAIKSGGRVMKNVTGLDLVKLIAGSYGTLGFVTEVTFKVLPVPRAEATVVVSGLNDAEAAIAMSAALATSCEVSGAAHLPESVRWLFGQNGLPDGPATLLRLEGLEASVTDRAKRLQPFMQRYGAVSQIDQGDSQQIWREIRDVTPFSEDGSRKPLWRISCAPSTGHQLLAALRLETGVNAFFDWQGGLVWMQMEGDAEAETIRTYLKRLGGGHATLIRARDEVRAAIATFEPQEKGVAALSAVVKAKLDPKGIFNPGRMG